jgi:hypothetical protein
MALLTSFDDDYKNTKPLDPEETKNPNEILLTNNCTSFSSSVATTIASSIRFIPSLLDFGEQ